MPLTITTLQGIFRGALTTAYKNFEANPNAQHWIALQYAVCEYQQVAQLREVLPDHRRFVEETLVKLPFHDLGRACVEFNCHGGTPDYERFPSWTKMTKYIRDESGPCLRNVAE